MKKILSVLAISTLVFGSATARKSVNLNYRNGGNLFSYATNGESDDTKLGTRQEQYLQFFNLNANQTGSDTLKLVASGDVLTFTAQIVPSIEKWGKNSFKSLTIDANFGALGLKAGFNGDGVAVGSFRVNTDAGDWDSPYFETFKPGSIFANSYAGFSINQTNIGIGKRVGLSSLKWDATKKAYVTQYYTDKDHPIYKDGKWDKKDVTDSSRVATDGGSGYGLGFQDSELFLQAAFNLAIPNSDASLKLIGTVISDRAWAGSSNDKADGTADDSEFLGAANAKYNDGHLAYTVFAIFSKPSVFNAQAFVKMNPHCLGCDRDQIFVPGAYVEVTAIKNLDIMGGFTMSIVEGVYEDYAFDLRARYAVNSALSFTYYGNLSVLNGDIADTAKVSGEIGSWGKAAQTPRTLYSNRFLWNYLHARFALSDGITAHLGIGALTDVGDGIHAGPQKGEGTELSVTPAATFYASKNAAINVGFNVTFRGIGKEEHPVAISDPAADGWTGDTTATQSALDVSLSLPVLFRVKL